MSRLVCHDGGGAGAYVPPLVSHELDGGLEVTLPEERLIALDVRDHVEVPVLPAGSDLGDPIGAGRVLRRGHLDRRPEGSAHLRDLLGVSRHDGVIQRGHALDAAPDPLDQRPAQEGVEGLVGETSGGEPGRDDTQHPAAQGNLPGARARDLAAIFTPRKVSEPRGKGQPTRRSQGGRSGPRMPEDFRTRTLEPKKVP